MSILNPSTVINRSITGAISGGITGGLNGAINGALNGGLNGIISGLFGGMFSGMGSSPGKIAVLGFKSGHPYAGYPGVLGPLSRTGGLGWPYRPSIEVTRSVNYETGTPVHSMQDFRSFRNNSSANITVSGQFSAQTIEEGQYVLAALHFLRVASLMSFGRGGSVPAGMPPPVLNLSAYGPNNINNVPVILDSIIHSYPPDVDYISVNGNDVPTLCTITAAMTVMLAPEQLRNFSLDAFAAGNMQNFV